MADEKLNTGPEVQKIEEAPAPAVADPAHGEAAVPEHPPEQAGACRSRRCGNLCGAD